MRELILPSRGSDSLIVPICRPFPLWFLAPVGLTWFPHPRPTEVGQVCFLGEAVAAFKEAAGSRRMGRQEGRPPRQPGPRVSPAPRGTFPASGDLSCLQAALPAHQVRLGPPPPGDLPLAVFTLFPACCWQQAASRSLSSPPPLPAAPRPPSCSGCAGAHLSRRAGSRGRCDGAVL